MIYMWVLFDNWIYKVINIVERKGEFIGLVVLGNIFLSCNIMKFIVDLLDSFLRL